MIRKYHFKTKKSVISVLASSKLEAYKTLRYLILLDLIKQKEVRM